MPGPIKPSEVAATQLRNIPEPVFEAFNELIAKHWDGLGADVLQDAVVELIKTKTGASHSEVFAQHWLDVEEAYRAEGWHVEYDKPAYCETYPAVFRFRQKRARR